MTRTGVPSEDVIVSRDWLELLSDAIATIGESVEPDEDPEAPYVRISSGIVDLMVPLARELGLPIVEAEVMLT